MHQTYCYTFCSAGNLWSAAEPPRLPLRRELSSLLIFKGLTEGEITRVCCLHRGANEHQVKKTVICFYCRLYQVLLHILDVSLPPSACSNPLCRHPPPSSEGGEGAPAPCTDFSSVLPSAGRYLPLFFCNQKKSRKTVKEKFRPLLLA